MPDMFLQGRSVRSLGSLSTPAQNVFLQNHRNSPLCAFWIESAQNLPRPGAALNRGCLWLFSSVPLNCSLSFCFDLHSLPLTSTHYLWPPLSSLPSSPLLLPVSALSCLLWTCYEWLIQGGHLVLLGEALQGSNSFARENEHLDSLQEQHWIPQSSLWSRQWVRGAIKGRYKIALPAQRATWFQSFKIGFLKT